MSTPSRAQRAPGGSQPVATPKPQWAEQTVESWAFAYVTSDDLAYKCEPPPPPAQWAPAFDSRDVRPSRPRQLRVTLDRPRSFKLGGLKVPAVRAELVHKFWHHELQAAELMCWALLRFPDTPPEFKRGLLRICKDEIRHMGLYAKHLELLGHAVGDFPVRDWFWERVPTCTSALQFVAFLGMGLEAANLEHTERFAGWFRHCGDELGAAIQDRVGTEEVAHVRFATHWFRKWTGAVNFDEWCRALPPPITPLLLKGKNLRWELRRHAAMPDEFLQKLAAWVPSTAGADDLG